MKKRGVSGRPDKYAKERAEAKRLKLEDPNLTPRQICELLGLPIIKLQRVYEWLK